MSRDDDEGPGQQQQQQPGPVIGRHRESGYITPSDHELIIDSIFAPCHDRLAAGVKAPPGSAVSDRRPDAHAHEPDGVCVDSTTSSSTLDDVVSASLAPYLACVIPPPPSITEQLVSVSVPAPPPISDAVTGLDSTDFVDMDPSALIVPPPPPPPASTGPSTSSAVCSKLPIQSELTPSQSLATRSTSSPVHIKRAPPTLPKQTKNSSCEAAASKTYRAQSAHNDVISLGDDVTACQRLVNGGDCLDFFPPPPPVDDLDLPPPARDNLPPPPPSVLQTNGGTLERAGSGSDTTVRRSGTVGVVRRTDGNGRRRLDNNIASPSSSLSSSSSSDGVSSELAVAMLAARLRAESNQPLSSGLKF